MSGLGGSHRIAGNSSTGGRALPELPLAFTDVDFLYFLEGVRGKTWRQAIELSETTAQVKMALHKLSGVRGFAPARLTVAPMDNAAQSLMHAAQYTVTAAHRFRRYYLDEGKPSGSGPRLEITGKAS